MRQITSQVRQISGWNKFCWIEGNAREVYLPRGWPETPDPHGDGVLTRGPEQPRHWPLGPGLRHQELAIDQTGVVSVLVLISHLQPENSSVWIIIILHQTKLHTTYL